VFYEISLSGWLVDQTGSYTSTFFLSGVSLICSAVILAAVRVLIRCTRGSSCLNWLTTRYRRFLKE